MSRLGSKWAARAGLLLGAALIASSIAVSAFAHARPVSVSPGDGAVLTTAPSQVSMDTSEEVSRKPGDNSLTLISSTGATVASAFTVSSTYLRLSLPVPAGLVVGKYTVRWLTTSAADGDAATGTWTFTYDPSKAPSAGNSDPVDHGSDVQPAATPTTPAATTTATPGTPTVPAATAAATSTATAPAAVTAARPAPPASGTGVTPPGTGLAIWLRLSGGLVLLASLAFLYASRRSGQPRSHRR